MAGERTIESAPLITFLTDFGDRDEYAGVMKGVIAGIHPGIRVVDISHRIEPQDIVHGAFILAAAYSYFPVGTIHVAIVDPGVGGDRRIVAVTCNGHHFLAPDNGLLERVTDRKPLEIAVSVTKSEFFLPSVSQTFHGRDVFAPVAAHMARGVPMEELGPVISAKSLVTGVVPRCRFESRTTIRGEVVAVDRFGNLMTNVDTPALDALIRRTTGKPLVVDLAGKTTIAGLTTAYGRVQLHRPMAIVGSRGLLEISVNCGSASRLFKVNRGDRVCVRGG